MNVLLADALSESVINRLKAAGCQVENFPTLKGDELTEKLAQLQPQVLVVRSTKVTEADMKAAPALELIVRAGAGYDTIDVSAASGLGIFIANCPGKNTSAVAELTIGLILSLDRSIPDNVMEARAGQWNKAKYAKAAGVKGRTLGVIGTGNIGQEVIRRAKALEMPVVAWSRSLTDERAAQYGVQRVDSPVEVARASDIVSLHVASTPQTQSLADAAFFEAMKEGAFFINTTRASVVDEEALVEAMNSKGLRAALDVFSNEPSAKTGEFSHALANHPSVYLTHHIGASTMQAQEAIAMEAARVIEMYASSGEVPNCVNLATQTGATHQITVRHLDKVGVLAKVLHEISLANWNVQEMENVIFDESKAACAYIRFDGFTDASVAERIDALDDVLAVSLIEL
ncbi:MAG: phosphoglycerate dehydrogenase [Bacteroidota bacterium]|nr:phosphoglycerate dehydrogenase [Bacteroidota bacterium]